DIDDSTGAQEAAKIGEAALYRHLNVCEEADWESAMVEVERRFGTLDILVNNAGVLSVGAISDTSTEEYMSVIRTNQLGQFLGLRAAIRLMKAKGGSVVNISSIAGLIGAPNAISYC